MARHFIIPDCQVKPGVPTEHLEWISKAIAHYKPDVVVNLGDFADMESLSSYKSLKEAEGLRYLMDLAAVREANEILFSHSKKWGRQKVGPPRKVLLLGNHEDRINRAVNENPHLEGFVKVEDLEYHKWYDEVHPFLEIAEIDGVHYSHYFQNPMGRAYAGTIENRIRNIGFSHVQGHQQGLRSGMVARSNGELVRGVAAGSCYLHSEQYMGQADSAYWRGCLVLNDVRHGQFDVMELSLDYLCREFGPGCHVWQFMKKNYPALSAHSPWLAQERLSRKAHR